MRFTPLTPARLTQELAEWAFRLATADGPPLSIGSGSVHQATSAQGIVIGFDGATEIGTSTLADSVGEALRVFGTQVIRASTSWWWRQSALRLELGRHDVDMLLTGWVDADSLQRELLDPVHAGDQPFITRLRNPATDRSVRQLPQGPVMGSILLLDGPFLLAAGLPIDGLVHLGVGPRTLSRALGPERSGWTAAFTRYAEDYRPAEAADIALSYDHATRPAAAGLVGNRFT